MLCNYESTYVNKVNDLNRHHQKIAIVTLEGFFLQLNITFTLILSFYNITPLLCVNYNQ